MATAPATATAATSTSARAGCAGGPASRDSTVWRRGQAPISRLNANVETSAVNRSRLAARVDRPNQPVAKGRTLAAPPIHETTASLRTRRATGEDYGAGREYDGAEKGGFVSRSRIGWALAALGGLLVVLSALADPLGIGEGGGVGYKQVTGMVVGAVFVLVGLVLARRGRATAEPAGTDV